MSPEAVPHSLWIVHRSTDLAAGDWEEVYRFDGRRNIEAMSGDFAIEREGDLVRLVDNTAPRPVSVFFTLTVRPAP